MDGIISWQQQKDLINRIRYCFAQISLGMLNPDLVIMDEFQRFKDLIEIDENDYSDSAMLSKKFLKDNTDSSVTVIQSLISVGVSFPYLSILIISGQHLRILLIDIIDVVPAFKVIIGVCHNLVWDQCLASSFT